MLRPTGASLPMTSTLSTSTRNADRRVDDDKKFRQHEYDFFAQDSWKIRRNLTLNLGLRYQFNGVPYEESGNLSNLLGDPTVVPLTFTNVGPGTGHLLFNNDFSNIEPRVGFSWDPWGDGKTAIRGAYGLFHDRVFGNLFGNARGNPPFEQDFQNFPGETINNFFASDAFPNVPPQTTPSSVVQDGSLLLPTIFDPNYRNALSQNWNFGIQRELPGNWVMDVAYVASKASHIARIVEANPPDPASGQSVSGELQWQTPTAWPAYRGSALWRIGGVATNALGRGTALNKSVGTANYNSLQTKITHRFSHGLQIQGSYTWAHAIDDSSDPLTPGNLGRKPQFPPQFPQPA